MKIARIFLASLISLLLTAQSAPAAEDFVLPEYGESITLPGVVPDPVPEALRPAVEAYEAGDYDTARTLFTPAAEEGAPVALYYMGLLHRFGQGGFAEDHDKGYAMLNQSADSAASADPQDGYIYRRALYSLGYMTQNGQGVRQSRGTGECLIRTSAKMGYPVAQYEYYRILTKKKSLAEPAVPWLERASNQGNSLALYWHGVFLGLHPDRGFSEAFEKLHLAALVGNKSARWLLEEGRQETDLNTIQEMKKGLLSAGKWRAVLEQPPSIFSDT